MGMTRFAFFSDCSCLAMQYYAVYTGCLVNLRVFRCSGVIFATAKKKRKKVGKEKKPNFLEGSTANQTETLHTYPQGKLSPILVLAELSPQEAVIPLCTGRVVTLQPPGRGIAGVVTHEANTHTPRATSRTWRRPSPCPPPALRVGAALMVNLLGSEDGMPALKDFLGRAAAVPGPGPQSTGRFRECNTTMCVCV